MRKAYRIILVPEDQGYTVFIPDFENGTQGKDLADALYMARDAIGSLGITMQDMGREIPEPGAAEYELQPGEIESFVDVDFAEYRRKKDNKKVRKNVMIPSWLNEVAESENINFSRILEEALKERLEVESR